MKNYWSVIRIILLVVITLAVFIFFYDRTQNDDELIGNNSNYTNGNQTNNLSSSVYCRPEQKNQTFCTMEYRPVCGWFNQTIKCFAYPCAQTYGNSCQACSAENVDYYTDGECPSVGINN
jgi:hypothetical protein